MCEAFYEKIFIYESNGQLESVTNEYLHPIILLVKLIVECFELSQKKSMEIHADFSPSE